MYPISRTRACTKKYPGLLRPPPLRKNATALQVQLYCIHHHKNSERMYPPEYQYFAPLETFVCGYVTKKKPLLVFAPYIYGIFFHSHLSLLHPFFSAERIQEKRCIDFLYIFKPTNQSFLYYIVTYFPSSRNPPTHQKTIKQNCSTIIPQNYKTAQIHHKQQKINEIFVTENQ